MLRIVRLTPGEVQALAWDLAQAAERGAGSEVLVAIDGPPQEDSAKFKVKINGGTWSPPMGSEVR